MHLIIILSIHALCRIRLYLVQETQSEQHGMPALPSGLVLAALFAFSLVLDLVFARDLGCCWTAGLCDTRTTRKWTVGRPWYLPSRPKLSFMTELSRWQCRYSVAGSLTTYMVVPHLFVFSFSLDVLGIFIYTLAFRDWFE